MIRLRYATIILTAMSALPLHGLFETMGDSDARSRALANANTAVPTAGSVVSANPALLAQFQKTSFGLTFFPRGLGMGFENTLLLSASASAVVPLSNAGGIGFGYQGYFSSVSGLSTYDEYRWTAAYGQAFFKRKLFLGFSVMLEGWNARSNDPTSPALFKTDPFLNFSLGAGFTPISELAFGFSAQRILGSPTADGLSRENYFSLLRLGGAFQKKNWRLLLDVSWHTAEALVVLHPAFEIRLLDEKLRFGGGVETQLQSKSLGITPSFGMGMKLGPMTFDYALAYSFLLGGAGNHLFTLSLEI